MSKLPRVAVAGLLATGCASALHAPEQVDALTAGVSAPEAHESRQLLERAAALHAERTLASAEAAIASFKRVAAGTHDRVAAAAGLAEVAIWIAGHTREAERRVESAGEAVRAGQLCDATAPDDPRCDYWLALALGVQARERRATGLDALPRMVQLLKGVADIDSELEHAGAHRSLALVYLRAPGWPGGPGDPDLGLEHARQAVALAPAFPPNRLCLAEALQAVEDLRGSEAAFAEAARLAREWLDRGHPDAGEWLALAESQQGLQ